MRGAPTASITIDGEPYEVVPGQSIAAVLLSSGTRAWRRTSDGQARGVFCAIGVCFDCTVTVDGIPHVRACVTPVRDGMRVETDGQVAEAATSR